MPLTNIFPCFYFLGSHLPYYINCDMMCMQQQISRELSYNNYKFLKVLENGLYTMIYCGAQTKLLDTCQTLNYIMIVRNLYNLMILRNLYK